MNPNLLHNPRTPVERRAQHQLWVITLILIALLLVIAIGFFLMRQT